MSIHQIDQLSTIPVFVGHDAPQYLRVHIQGLGEEIAGDSWLFKNQTGQIYVEKLGLNTFIQTDRPLYKPGQTSKLLSYTIVFVIQNILHNLQKRTSHLADDDSFPAERKS